MDQKKCNKCNLVKPFDDFHNRSVSSDGKDGACKECRSRLKTDTAGLKLKDYKDNIHNYLRIGKPCEEILEAMGYELYNDDNPVHKQFEERLATKNRFI